VSGATRTAIEKFRIDIPQLSLDDLHDRLTRARWASDVPGPNPEDYGVSLAWVRELTEYWRDSYDWRAAEARLNGYPQFVTEIDGQEIHFLHIESPEPGAIPLILTHGWPGSVVELRLPGRPPLRRAGPQEPRAVEHAPRTRRPLCRAPALSAIRALLVDDQVRSGRGRS
jgi:hypothetical protein